MDTTNNVIIFESILAEMAPYMSTTVSKGRNNFGDEWQKALEKTLEKIFQGDLDRLKKAAEGYLRFSLDAMRLQKIFEKERTYFPKTYEDASTQVYQNKEYMFDTYLPGILLSHYLWPHHYRQLLFFHKNFMPKITASNNPIFYDVGVGTGFYSREILSRSSAAVGEGLDISDHSLEFACKHLAAFDLRKRWTPRNIDIILSPPEKEVPFLVSVEVLEHLENPTVFLKAMRRLLRKGGVAFITAAITAPNEDHIYLYENCQQIISQLESANFTITECYEDMAYYPRKDEPVPRLAAFIVT